MNKQTWYSNDRKNTVEYKLYTQIVYNELTSWTGHQVTVSHRGITETFDLWRPGWYYIKIRPKQSRERIIDWRSDQSLNLLNLCHTVYILEHHNSAPVCVGREALSVREQMRTNTLAYSILDMRLHWKSELLRVACSLYTNYILFFFDFIMYIAYEVGVLRVMDSRFVPLVCCGELQYSV